MLLTTEVIVIFKNVPVGEHCQFLVIQIEETKHIENKSLNGEFQRYILFFISILWLAVYQLNQKDACINSENRYRETIITQLRVAYGTIPEVTNLWKNVENCQMCKEEGQ